jgi:hypothetical protein
MPYHQPPRISPMSSSCTSMFTVVKFPPEDAAPLPGHRHYCALPSHPRCLLKISMLAGLLFSASSSLLTNQVLGRWFIFHHFNLSCISFPSSATRRSYCKNLLSLPHSLFASFVGFRTSQHKLAPTLHLRKTDVSAHTLH